jgi:ABC-2 type transport system permease protein
MTTFYLKILFLLRPIFIRMGVNFDQLVAIVEVKLKMDNRRTRFNQMNQKQKESNASFYWTLLIYALLSSVFGFLIYFSTTIIAVYSMAFAYVMFMLAMTLITDFSSVILDSNDNAVLLPRPIDDRTLLIARITHILMYLLSMMFALSLPVLVVTVVKHGIFSGFIFLIISLLSLILVVFLTNIFYLVLMKFTSEEKLRNVINSFQIVLTFMFMGGYRIVGRLVDFDSLTSNLELKVSWWHYLIPPVWMGNTMNVAINHQFDGSKFIFIVLTLTVPFMVFFLVNNVFSGGFSQGIAGMDVAKRKEKVPNQTNNSDFVERLAQIFTGTAIERGTFEFVWKLTTRDRKFKLRVYPSLAYLLIYPVFMIGAGRSNESFSQQIENLRESSWMLVMIIYLCFSILLTIRSHISQSEEFKAAWIFNIAPLTQPGEVLSGAFRSVMVKFMLPIILFLCIILPIIWGLDVFDDVLFGALTVLNISLLNAIGSTHNKLPFSTEVKNNAGSNFLRTILFMIATGLMGLMHFFLMKVSYVIPVFAIFQLILALFLLKKYREVGWEKITME